MRVAALILAALALLVASTAATAATVTVRAGDTLSHIAVRNSVTERELARVNNIADPDHVRVGDVLRLPAASAGTSSAPPRPRRHRVRRGDTLSHLAARYGTSVAALVRANRLSSSGHIRIGSTLTIPGGTAGATSAPSSASGRHRVLRGETLDGIARRYGLSARALAAANGIRNPNRVRAGRVLRVPGGGGGSVAPVAGASSSTVVALLADASARHGVDPALARAVAWQESGFNQRAVSSAGAVGVMQLMPGTARWVGEALLGRPIDRRDVRDNIDGGVAYLAYLMRTTPSLRAAIGSYYQGPGSYRRDGAFDDTKAYIASVSALMRR